MSTYSWQIPAPPSVAPPVNAPGSPASGAASSPSDLTGLLDVAFDPLTGDLIDTPDGGILETTDSRTAVTFQMECALNAWWGDPTQGSRLRILLGSDGPDTIVDPIDVIDETKRCLQLLVDEGVITDLAVAQETDEYGRLAILMTYRDSSTGHPIDIAFSPFIQ